MSQATPQSSPASPHAAATSSGGPAAPAKAPSGCGCAGQSASAVMAGPAGPASGGAPSMRPAGVGGAIGGQWHSAKRITGTWCINEVRNAWVYVDGLSWRKLANGLDSVTLAMSLLGASALATGTATDLREEADGMIHEMYVW